MILQGTYTLDGRQPIGVTGVLSHGVEHRCTMSIPFDSSNNQPFTLLHHTWERDVFAGTTTWGGCTFGVQGFRT